MEKIKILYILPSLAKGGAERLILDTMHALNNDPAFESKLVILNAANEYEELSRNINFEICDSKYIPSITGKPVDDRSKLNNVILNFKPDIIHSSLFESEIVSRKTIYPEIIYITHCHDNMIQFQNFRLKTVFRKKLITNYFEKIFMLKKYKECNNNFIAVSNDTVEYFTKCLPGVLRRITLIPNGINVDRFSCQVIRTISENKVIDLISAGSLTVKKNHIFLVEVIKILISRSYKVHLTILGEGVQRTFIEKKINHYGLSQFIELKGNVSNVGEYYEKSMIYVHSALYEPFGLAILEAMASGLPCVALDGRGNRDIIQNDFNGYILVSAKPELFAEKIITLIKNPSLYGKMSLNAVVSARRYDISVYSAKLAGYYKELVMVDKGGKNFF